jgi:hypothetical protein
MTKTRREKKAKAIPEPVGYSPVSDLSQIIKKRAKEKRACPWVVMDQLQMSAVGLMKYGTRSVDDTTVFVITILTPNEGPVATWKVKVKKVGPGASVIFEDTLRHFQLYCKHNDPHRYVV